MRVCTLPCDRDGSGLYRVGFPSHHLTARYGWECASPPAIPPFKTYPGKASMYEYFDLDIHLPRIAPDIVVFQRPVDSVAPGLIRQAKANGARIVVETDDWMAGLPDWNPAFKKLDIRFSPGRNTILFAECCALADLVTVSTPFLAAQHPNALVLRNRLEWSMWENMVPVCETRAWERTRIGYMGAAEWHGGDLKLLTGLIGPWLERNPGVDFVASHAALEILQVPKGQRIETAVLEQPDGTRVGDYHVPLFEIPSLLQFDIGLVPLNKHRFNDAKSHLKGMEYAAMGIPCIASDTESYRYWVEPGVNGFIARKPRDFTRHLDTMLSDMQMTRRMGRAAREKASRHTYAEHISEWHDAYSALLEKDAAA